MRVNIGRSSDSFLPPASFPTSALLLCQWNNGAGISKFTAAGLFVILTRFPFNRISANQREYFCHRKINKILLTAKKNFSMAWCGRKMYNKKVY